MTYTKINLLEVKKYLSHPYAFISLLFLAPLPFLYLLSVFYFHVQELNSLEDRLEIIHLKALNLRLQKEKESSFLAQMNHADHYYIDKHLETLSFLEPEIKKYKIQSADVDNGDSFHDRLRFLEESNRLIFAEEAIRQCDQLQEVEERQQNPVEVNEQDLKKLLTLVEGVPIPPFIPQNNRPQLIIKNFELSKKTISLQDPVFIVNMHLIKREKLHSNE